MQLAEIRTLIDKADVAYYRTGLSEIMTDAEYDALKAKLKELDDTDERLTRVGVPFDEENIGNKVRHNIPMGSLDNTDDGILGFEPWLSGVQDKLGLSEPPVIMASQKMDGGSICATYKSGKLVSVVTRGNGDEGEDITANAVNFKYLPTVLPVQIDADVRGEAILSVDDYKAIRSRELGRPFDEIPPSEQSNPRNIGNGIIGRHDGKDSDKICFFAFNLVFSSPVDPCDDFSNESEKLAILQKLGFNPVPHVLCPNPECLHDFYTMTVAGRDSLPFEIDGIVVVLNQREHQEYFITDLKSQMRPKHSRAVKFAHKSNITTIEDVLVTVGHTRMIIPTAVLKEVRIGGVNVTSALLNNYEEVERLGIAVGDEVEVVLSGDIIPKIIRKVSEGATRTPIVEPKICPSCATPTTRSLRGKDGACTYCNNAKCPAAAFAKLDCWIGGSKKGVGILDIGDSMIKALWDNGMLADPADLYTLTVDGLKNVMIGKGVRIGLSRAEKIVANINNKKSLPLHLFLGSLGIELLGRRRVVLMQEAAAGKLDKLEDWLDLEKLQTIQLPGYGDAIRAAVVQGIKDNLELINKLLVNGVTISYQEPTPVVESTDKPASPVAGKSFCWTGTRDLVEEVVAAGGIVKSGVSKGLDYLVQKDALSKTVKTAKAESYGTKVIGVDYLRDVLNGSASL